jgi:lipoprotein-releasing system permease protein
MWNVFLAIRYFLEKRKEGFISFINITSVAGVALGVASLIIVLSVMNGFDEEVEKKIVGTYSHIMIVKEGGIAAHQEIAKMAETLPAVKSAAGFVTGQAVIRKDVEISGVLVKGIDTEKEKEVSDVVSYIAGADKELKGNTVILGTELMRNLGIRPGDTVEIIVPRSELDVDTREFKVIGGFSSGRYDYDANLALMEIAVAQDIFALDGSVSGVAVRLRSGEDVTRAKGELQHMLKFPYVVKSWMDMDRNLMSALAMEKKMMFVILGVIILVACFNISSSLMMMVMEKTRDIGILRSIGANSAGVSSVFFLEGFFVGSLGVVLGTSAGIFVANRVNQIAGLVKDWTGYEMFPNDVYYFSEIPSKVSSQDITTIIIMSMALTLAAGLYPAWKASRLDPVEAIRYE